MIKNRNMHRDARRRHGISGNIDMSSDTRQYTVVAFDPDNQIKVCAADIIFTVAGDTAAAETVTLGTYASPALYSDHAHNIVVATSEPGDVERMVLLTMALLPAGTALIVGRGVGASTNTAELRVAVCYELVDRNTN